MVSFAVISSQGHRAYGTGYRNCNGRKPYRNAKTMPSCDEIDRGAWALSLGGEAKTSDDSQGSEFVEARKLAYLIIAGFCNLQVTLGAEHKLRRLLAAAQVTGRGYRISQS